MSMRRVYTSTANFRAPYDSSNISFAGLGTMLSAPGHAAYDINKWPAGRSYYSTHFYRAPYQAGYYQSGALRGLSDPVPLTQLQLFGIGAAAVALGYFFGKRAGRA